MPCPSAVNIKFSSQSIEAIEDIRRRNYLFSVLSNSLSAGIMVNIFLGNKPLTSAYNISQTDFELFAQAMLSLPLIQKRIISDIARRQQLYHSGSEREFWKGVERGCRI